MKTFTFLKRDLSSRGVLCVEAVAFGLFFFAPWLGVKYVALCVFCGVAVLSAKSAVAQRLVLTGLAVMVYAAAFILTPVFVVNPLAELLSRPPGPSVALVMKLGTLIALCVVGVVWALLSFRISTIGWGRVRGQPIWTLALLPAALCVIYYPSWIQGLAYAGDESYHALSIFMNQLLVYNIVRTGWGVVALFVWTVCSPLILKFKGKGRLAAMIGWVVFGFIVLALQPFWYSPDLVGQSFILSRVGRFPSAQPWISAFLGCLTLQSWLDMLILPMEIMRLLPMLALAALGLAFMLDHRCSKRNPIAVAAFALSLLTIPNLLYHGTIVYLELPAVFLAFVCLTDARRLLVTPYPDVCRRWSWWALVFLGFTKETAFPWLLIYACFRSALWIRSVVSEPTSRNGTLLRLLRGEVTALFCVLGPAFLYAGIRFTLGGRPYGANFGNAVNLGLWLEMASSLIVQTGFVLVVAVIGLALLWKRRRLAPLFLSIAFFIGMAVFLICDDSQYVGLARFNLLLLPPILFWAWEGFNWVMKSSPVASLVLCFGVFFSNFTLSPVDFRGEREIWGMSGERWYRFEECFDTVLAMDSKAKVLMGNMPVNYCTSIAGNRRRWGLTCKQIYYADYDFGTEVLATLSYAREKKFDVVIFRLNDSFSGPIPIVPGWKLVKVFPSKHGTLLLFRKGSHIKYESTDAI